MFRSTLPRVKQAGETTLSCVDQQAGAAAAQAGGIVADLDLRDPDRTRAVREDDVVGATEIGNRLAHRIAAAATVPKAHIDPVEAHPLAPDAQAHRREGPVRRDLDTCRSPPPAWSSRRSSLVQKISAPAGIAAATPASDGIASATVRSIRMRHLPLAR